ncbi:MAG: hypothetical protein CMP13_02275 [Zunongwangia sp.]|nr:hypothetical protein [Zunongwangia profunda]MAG87508.1 hypothetical protein [Flavobacteriaceae bacterium]MAS69455.1 hypothetical protein [Zunongwangia sp.]
MKNLFSLILMFFAIHSTIAQCSCDQTISSSNVTSSGYVFKENTTYCIQGNISVGEKVYFENNVTICVPSGSKLTINNQMPSSSSYPRSNIVNWNISGNLIIPNEFYSSFNMNILEGGKVSGLYNGIRQDLNVYGNYFNLDIDSGGSYIMGNLNFHNTQSNTINNAGDFSITGEIAMRNERASLQFFNYNVASLTGNLNFTQGGLNLFENYGTFDCNGIHSTDPTLHLKNDGDMTTRGNYDDTVGSNFSNCGTLHMSQNWTNLQGRIINTGNMTVTVSSVAFNSTGRIDNYSIMSLRGVTMAPDGAVFYNEGEVTFETNQVYNVKFYGPGSNQQPDHSTSTNYGRFKWPGVSNGNALVKGNLNLVNTNGKSSREGMFGNNSVVSDNGSVKYGNCNDCTVITEYDQCANADGTWPINVNKPEMPKSIPVNRHVRTHL